MEFYIFYSMNIPEYTQTLGEEKREKCNVQNMTSETADVSLSSLLV